MLPGLIFDIKEFALNDGPGVRLTVFLKGCPLKCIWCHNPEGISDVPQINLRTDKTVGKYYTSKELAEHLMSFKDMYNLSGGGITFSGGEPTQQADFIEEVIDNLHDIHINLDTSGYCESDVFENLIKKVNLVYFDLKLIDENQHIEYTGKSNDKILNNLKILSNSSVPYVIRIPLIPDITDTKENLEKVADIINNLQRQPERIDTLPYNKLAGGKYDSYDMIYQLKDKNSENNKENIEYFKNLIKEQNLCKSV